MLKNPFFKSVAAIVTSWWFVGLIGWALIVMNYPIDVILPKYAG